MSPSLLKRELGVFGATLMGLGSIVGTGVFVSIPMATEIAGPGVIWAVTVAALVAVCNGLNSAQLAANHPVSGGTYEYGYKYLNPWLGFTAGWMFLLAKTASAATAALGFAGYFLSALGVADRTYLILTALIALAALTLIVLTGIRRSQIANTVIVSVTLLSLTVFIAAGLPEVRWEMPSLENDSSIGSILHATALMFVAYTGYGRIATMSEEVREPSKTIPKAIIFTLVLTMVLYVAVAIVVAGTGGVDKLSLETATAAAPLEVIARSFPIPGVSQLLAVGAITAMLGVLLNLILGLSRVWLAMGRRLDMPRVLARLNPAGTTPYVAVVVVEIAIALLILTGNVKTTWSFSAFSVLIYYAITNAAALQLTSAERLYPQWLAWVGLGSCLFLAFWVETQIWLAGLALIGGGLIWRAIVRHPMRN
ncbi:MAG: amino acid permease [Microcoleus sp. PH2017_22_RUC_O_B]|uniref:APC family permease n=1 Tax=unclassified Microcoleus TaxID=2642155 RepID=UPI001D382F0B|nr:MULTISPECIES: APC family permease [unclassified Microcoleus]MCC3527615.1 amino acid permease [Microcoleus sp. PH2017_21_RUC_O_A]MCC3544168.1 amino acid permease [Microcoleus sp. PH2017_22_RUC_O_B]